MPRKSGKIKSQKASKGVQKLLSNIKWGNNIIEDEENEEEEIEKSPKINNNLKKKNNI